MFIKICGITSSAALTAAVENGVDAIGFVFAPSVRRLTPAQAAELSSHAPTNVLRIAVTQHPTQQLVDEIVDQVRPDYLQTDVEDLAGLKIPVHVRVLPVYRGAAVGALPARILFEGPRSGIGQTGDWTQAAALAQRAQLILAGGLNAGNVMQAIEQVRPFGVDVSSGVESAPGVKDARRIAEFVTRVRSASADVVPVSGVR